MEREIVDKLHNIETGIIQIKTSQPVVRDDVKFYTQTVALPYSSGMLYFYELTYYVSNGKSAVTKIYSNTSANEAIAIGDPPKWYVGAADVTSSVNAATPYVYVVSTQPGVLQYRRLYYTSIEEVGFDLSGYSNNTGGSNNPYIDENGNYIGPQPGDDDYDPELDPNRWKVP